MVQNKGLVFKQVPTHAPVAGEHLAIEARDFAADAAPPPGGLVVRNHYVSFDPYQRGAMREPDQLSYCLPFIIGVPIWNGTVATVLKSDSPGFAPGDVVWGMITTEEYAAVPAQMMATVFKLQNPYGLDWRLFVGVLGISGLSAYASLWEFGKLQKGQTILISAASGAVGQIAGQLAKREGLRVIGSVGSDEKLEFITKELGFDAGFNYKREPPGEALPRLAPEGLDIYFDSVGAEHLDAALVAMKDFGRIVCGGMISQYNKTPEDYYGVKNLQMMFLKRLSMNGYIVSDPGIIGKYMEEYMTKMMKWVHDGEIKVKESVTYGIDNAVDGYLSMFTGSNFGKAVLEIASLERVADGLPS